MSNKVKNQDLVSPDHNNITIYNDGEIELSVSINSETVWLNRQQMAELFDRDVKTIGKHINNVFKEKELEKISTVANFATVQKEGNREVVRSVEYYNLDVTISVGYRVKSQRGVNFRQWATKVLKQYIYNGYAINSEKITHQRFKELENDVNLLRQKVDKIDDLVENNHLDTKQGIFYNGQIFDAYIFINDIIKSAKRSITLLDNYIDENTLTILSKREKNCKVTIYTQKITGQLKLDIKKHNAQYPHIEIKKFDLSHDKFLIIDDKEVYHIGASLKDLGKKWFAFSKMDLDSFEIIGRLG